MDERERTDDGRGEHERPLHHVDDDDHAVTREPARGAHAARGLPPLLEDADQRRLRERWESIQASFIDEPRGAVEAANDLVSELSDSVLEGFRRQRRSLEAQWDRDEETDTEDLRVSLQRYRAFFDRLLSL